MVVQLHDKSFEAFIKEKDILAAVENVAREIERDYRDKNPLVVGVLDGCVLFMADLIREINFDFEIGFTKVASYEGTSSTGKVRELLSMPAQFRGRHVILIEDIVDTGNTIDYLFEEANKQEPASVSVAALLFKPDAYHHRFPVNYVGLEIPNKFIVGYGLDYDGLGRNLRDIYILKEEKD